MNRAVHRHDGPHAHSHAALHAEARAAGTRGLTFVLVLTACFMGVELIGGYLSHSLALMADAAHMLTDVASLALSLFAMRFAQRPASAEKSYGYIRLEILAALVNGATLLVLAVFIFLEAFRRLRAPTPVEGGLMLGVAVAGLVVNLIAARILHGSAGHSLNVRGAYLHVVGDLLGSIGAIAAALVILATGWLPADPLISIAVGFLIVVGSWKLVRDSVNVLLEAVPPHIDLQELRAAMHAVAGVRDVHDLHVWTLTSGYLAMSGHAVVEDPLQAQRVLDELHDVVRDRFGIRHVTVQIENLRIHSIDALRTERPDPPHPPN